MLSDYGKCSVCKKYIKYKNKQKICSDCIPKTRQSKEYKKYYYKKRRELLDKEAERYAENPDKYRKRYKDRRLSRAKTISRAAHWIGVDGAAKDFNVKPSRVSFYMRKYGVEVKQ